MCAEGGQVGECCGVGIGGAGGEDVAASGEGEPGCKDAMFEGESSLQAINAAKLAEAVTFLAQWCSVLNHGSEDAVDGDVHGC